MSERVKKVVFLVLHLGYGGTERAVISEANLLSDFCDVEIISAYKLLKVPAFKVNSKVKITYLTEGVSPNKQQIKDAIKTLRPWWLLKELVKSAKILYLRTALMKKAVKNLDADIVISSRYLYHKLLTKNVKKDTVCIAQEHNHHNGNKRYIKKQVKAVRGMDFFMPVSKELTDFYSSKVKGKTVCKFIPHHLERFPNEISALTGKNIISVGRLSSEKAPDELIEVFRLVAANHPDWNLHIVGDGLLRPYLEQLTASYGLEGRVILHGTKSQKEIGKLMLDCSIYIMTSHTESFGLALLEAQSFGLPCVAFDSARGAKEIVTNGENGILIPSRSWDEMARAIDELISDPELACALGKCGRERSKNYSYDVVKKQWRDFILSLEGGK